MAYQGEQKRKYQNAWTSARRDAWINENGPCAQCGSSDNLEVDHIVPRRVSGAMATREIWSRRQEIRDRELAKCQVLCKSCHQDKSNTENPGFAVHGWGGYKRGCRCDVCRAANTAQVRSQRAKRSPLV